ncbi:hypothetical protein GYM54_05795 [Pseudomonas sp. MTM4]|uniref:hypothetical protein n=1 Tax=unclassified Pseudomonas TaxID=196821 RepID=UPI0018D22295|nr:MULTISPECIES: hypothetical protein [unclassified Pseudomonas]MBC8650910.1 hypothetical protein [Pseudomonas sp. MT4]QXY90087.1 hypothetical protein GYM54_05795 [Pseudomonas sp. MTM4]
MSNTLVLMIAGLIFASGAALADTELSNPSTTGNQAIEQPSSDIGSARDERDAPMDDSEGSDDEPGLGTMGTGATGTTGGMGATTGTDTIGDREDTDQ